MRLDRFDAGILLLGFLILIRRIAEPPIRMHDFNTAIYLAYSDRFLASMSCEVNCFYTSHHPLLLDVFGVPGFLLWGWSIWPIRLLQILVVLWGLNELRSLANRRWNKQAGYAAVGILLATPMFLYYAQMPNYEPTVTAFLMAAANRYDIYTKNPTDRNRSLLVVVACLGLLADWHFYYIWAVLLVFTYAARFAPGKELRKEIERLKPCITPLVVLTFAFLTLHLIIVAQTRNANALVEIWSHVGERTQHKAELLDADWWLIHVWRMLHVWAMVPLLVTVLGFREAIRNREHYAMIWIPLLIAPGLAHFLVFPQGAWEHEYWTYPMAAGFGLGAAYWGSMQSTKGIAVICVVTFLIGASTLIERDEVTRTSPHLIAIGGYAHEEFGEGSHLMISFELYYPELFWGARTGQVSAAHGNITVEMLEGYDGALICEEYAPADATILASYSEIPYDERTEPEVLSFRWTGFCDETIVLIK